MLLRLPLSYCFGVLLAGLISFHAHAQLKIPTPAVHSPDGSVMVYAVSKDAAGLRSPIMFFVDEVNKEMSRALRMKFGSKARPIEIAVGDQVDGNTNVVWQQVRSVDGLFSERIELPAPETSDLELFRTAIVGAFVRTWIEENKTVEQAGQLPLWFYQGLSRYTSIIQTEEGLELPAFRLADFEALYISWATGELPLVTEFMGTEIPPQLAGGMLEWFFTSIQKASPVKVIMEACARGEEPTALQLGRLCTASPFLDDMAIDFAFDRWLTASPTYIFQPGTTTYQMIDRWRIQLTVFPGPFHQKAPYSWAPRSLDWLQANAKTPEIKTLARRMAINVRIGGAGRDEMFDAVTDSYARFFNAIAEGAKPQRIQALFTQAEEKRRLLEKLASTKPIRQKPL